MTGSNQILPRMLLAGFSLLLSMASLSMLTGCGAEEKSVSSSNSNLTQQVVLDETLSKEDFSFPSREPRLTRGAQVFSQNCAVCHGQGKKRLTYEYYKSARPIDDFLLLTRGDRKHPRFDKLTRDERWEAVFYSRYLAGGFHTKMQYSDLEALFGGNCAVCHGKKGFADGSLYTGHGPHELGMSPVKMAFHPPPANFHSYSRLYNRTDEELVRHIQQGLYPSAMPSFQGRQDIDKKVVFNEDSIRDLVKYVRTFAIDQKDFETIKDKPLGSVGGAVK
jgi:mono/diheme cytochrome c family protein